MESRKPDFFTKLIVILAIHHGGMHYTRSFFRRNEVGSIYSVSRVVLFQFRHVKKRFIDEPHQILVIDSFIEKSNILCVPRKM